MKAGSAGSKRRPLGESQHVCHDNMIFAASHRMGDDKVRT